MKQELSRWLTLQGLMRDLQHAPGWDAFVAAIRDRREEGMADLLKGGHHLHDKNAGFVEGLDWVLAYPQTLVAMVEQYRQVTD